MKTALQALALFALPFGIIFRVQKDDIFTRDVGWAARRCEHLALHRRFDFAGNRHQKIVPPRALLLRLFVCLFVEFVLAVYPFLQFIENSWHVTLPHFFWI